MSDLSITVREKPVGQPRPRAARFGNSVRIYNPPTADAWRLAVELAAIDAAVDQDWRSPDEPLELKVVFWMPRPKAHFRADGQLKESAPLYCHTKPDLDNLLKSTMEGLEIAGAVNGDQLIVAIDAAKLYGREEDTGASLRLSKAISRTKVDNHG